MKQINIFEETGKFAGNKDIARDIRLNKILPVINKKEDIILNFKNVESATQSFIHATISEIIRQEGIEVLDRIYFKECNDVIKKIIGIVIEYMQDSNS